MQIDAQDRPRDPAPDASAEPVERRGSSEFARSRKAAGRPKRATDARDAAALGAIAAGLPMHAAFVNHDLDAAGLVASLADRIAAVAAASDGSAASVSVPVLGLAVPTASGRTLELTVRASGPDLDVVIAAPVEVALGLELRLPALRTRLGARGLSPRVCRVVAKADRSAGRNGGRR